MCARSTWMSRRAHSIASVCIYTWQKCWVTANFYVKVLYMLGKWLHSIWSMLVCHARRGPMERTGRLMESPCAQSTCLHQTACSIDVCMHARSPPPRTSDYVPLSHIYLHKHTAQLLHACMLRIEVCIWTWMLAYTFHCKMHDDGVTTNVNCSTRLCISLVIWFAAFRNAMGSRIINLFNTKDEWTRKVQKW